MSNSEFLQVVTVLATAITLSSCAGVSPASATAKADGVRPVAVARVVRADLARTLELAAEFRPRHEIEVHSKVSGYAKAVYVDVGDRVSKGQLLAEIEVPEMAQELTQAKATLKRTETEIERARGELQRAEIGFKMRELSYKRLLSVMKARPTLVAQQEIDDHSARLQEAEAQVRTAQAALAVTQEQVQVVMATNARLETMATYLRITAPFAGVITKRLVDPGAMVQAGTASHTQALPVVRLSQIDHLRLILPVPESIAGRIRIGAPVEVRVDSLNRVFQGRVSRFSGKLESSTRTMETEVDIPNTQFAIMPGMYGYAELKLDQRHDAIAVPVQAVSGHGATASVLAVADGRLEDRRVEVGLETPSLTEVLSGLKEGELVVIGNRSQLRAGMAVEPKEVASTGAAGSH